MPRRCRSWTPGAGAHVISRFVDRRFHLVDDVDRGAFLRAMTRANDRWDWSWLSYALMSSHVHYGLLAGLQAPDPFFRSTHTRFAQRYHRRTEGRTLGPVFADRPTLHPVKQSHLAKLVAYHHRNPVEAGVVERPSDSTWTSHRAYLRRDPAPPWLDVEHSLDILGFRDTAAGRRQFDEFVTEVDLIDLPWSSEPAMQPPPRQCAEVERVEWHSLISVAREVSGLPCDVPLTSRRHHAALTRKLIAIVATSDLGQSYAKVGAQLDMTASGVFSLLTRRRPDVMFEGLLAELRRRFLGK